jgi:hypothetical protein
MFAMPEQPPEPQPKTPEERLRAAALATRERQQKALERKLHHEHPYHLPSHN